jgi:lysine 2,3-aminomutase
MTNRWNEHSNWQELMQKSVRTSEALSRHFDIDFSSIREVETQYPIRINPYFLDRIKQYGEPLARQVIPDIREIKDASGWIDPLAEEKNSPVPNLVHRYPDRVLFLVSSECAAYCRFCTRKRKIGHWNPITDQTIEAGLQYIRNHKEVRDVLISGGDPLLLSDDRLDWILHSVREIPHVEIIRIGTRIPSVLPQRITKRLVRMLKKYAPLYLNVHFNHPAELTDEAKNGCRQLADGGIPLGSQTVLLKGINDHPRVIAALMKQLLMMRIRPYYLLQADLVRGTDHFRTTIQTGIEIMKSLRGHISGMAVPAYVIDLPGGGGKVPILPEYVIKLDEKEMIVKNYQGEIYRYPQPDPAEEMFSTNVKTVQCEAPNSSRLGGTPFGVIE